MKTKEELNGLKIEYESLNRKLAELTDDELEQVTGGVYFGNLFHARIHENSEQGLLIYDPEHPDTQPG